MVVKTFVLTFVTCRVNLYEPCSSKGGLSVKKEIACYDQFLLFPVFSKDLFSGHVKTRACLGKG